VAAITELPAQDAGPYRRARAEYADRYADLAAGKRNWQLAALGMFALAAMSATASIIQVRQVKRIPYVVAVDRSDGYAITIPSPMSPSNVSIDLRTIEQNEVAAFIRHAAPLTPMLRAKKRCCATSRLMFEARPTAFWPTTTPTIRTGPTWSPGITRRS